MITLKLVTDSEKEVLYNIFQKYLYEMTLYYEDEMDDKGNYVYSYFDNYFVESNRKALFIMYDDKIAGFIMLNKHSYLGQEPDYVVAEFTVLPIYRKRHIAKEAMTLVYTEYPGKWELKFSLKNSNAVNFWRKSTEAFKPTVYQLEEGEEVLSFETN